MENKDLLTLEQLEEGTPTDKIIILKSVFKNGKYTVQPAKNPDKNWFHGVPRLSEDQKKTLDYYVTPESKITLVDGITFDLSDEVQAANWNWVKHCATVCDSFEEVQRTPGAQFYVFMAGREARVANKVSDLKYRAQKHIMEDSPLNYENRALVLDSDLTGESPEEIKQFLLGIAEKQPVRIIAAYEAKDLSIKLLFIRAEKAGSIIQRDGMYLFGNTILGTSRDASIALLRTKENNEILSLLEQEVKNKLILDAESSSSKPKTYNFNKGK